MSGCLSSPAGTSAVGSHETSGAAAAAWGGEDCRRRSQRRFDAGEWGDLFLNM